MSKATSSNVVDHSEHKVFINFRGKELRGNFVSHLTKALVSEGVNVFTDNHERMGKDLEIFFTRIEESCIAIAVISSLYSESKWCLNELAKINECVKKNTLEVFPVFYKVGVETVKRRKEKFGENFERLVKKEHTKRKVWRRALRFVTEIKGEVVDEASDEVQVIDKIVKDVKIKLGEIRKDQVTKSPAENITMELSKGREPETSSSSETSPFIGIKSRLQKLEEKLNFELEEVTRVVGVVGMPGIGKTTLVKKLLEDWGSEFVHIMFLDDIRKKSKSPGFDSLHRDLLHGLMRSKYDGKENKDIELPLEALRTELSKSKVLIVLDDVSEKIQIDMILGGRKWLREGSRVVITTSSMSVVKDGVDETYLVPGLSDEDGFKYFEKYAFSGSCDPSFTKLAKEFVDYSRGHPLALKVLGGELIRKDKAYWESKLRALARSPISNTIQNVLRIPYDDLTKHHKDLFLDVAFFFRFEDGYHVRSLLDSSVRENVSEIRHLADKFLINICGGRLEVNDLMYTFAMGLESQSSSEDSTSGSRLFNHGEIIAILRNKEEATKIRGIFLDMSEVPRRMSLGSDTFKDMNDLRYLKFFDSSCPKDSEAKCNLNFPNGLEFTLPEIRYLHWLKFSLRKLPKDFNPKNLIDLKLPHSRIEQLWDGDKDTSKLKWLDLNHSSKLRTLSGLSQARKLQSMNLEGCTELKTVHEELQNMKCLMFLNLRGCTSLKSLPQMKLISLKTLILSGCSNLEEFGLTPQNLEELYLDGTAIKELPPTIGNLQKLVLLTLKDCKRLTTLPVSIENLKALQKLVLSGCKSFAIFPEVKENMKHLRTLLLDGTAIQEMPRLLKRFTVNQGGTSTCSDCNLREWPHEIYTLSSVQRLCLSRNNFRSLPKNISYLYNLKWLDLKYCEQLISLPMLPPNLHWLDAHGCISLEDIESPLALILAETEHSHSTFTFTNCTKLDHVAKNGIISYVRRKVQSMSDALAHQEKGSKLDVLIGVCYPGWQVPVWFNHRTVGSELKQKLNRHWNEAGLTGIVLCAVVSFKDYKAQNNRLLVRCTSDFKEEDKPLIQFNCILGGWTEHGMDRPRDIIKSFGHVFIGYTSLLHFKKWDIEAECVATEASFKFEVTDGAKQITNCEVLKCGFTLIYAPTKPVHRLYIEKHSDHDEIMSGSTPNTKGNMNSEESNFHIRSGATSVSSMALDMGSETKEKVESSEAKSVSAPSTSNGEVPLVVRSNATPNICENISGGSMSPGSSEGGEVIDEVSPKNDETKEEVKNTTCVSFLQYFTRCLRIEQ